MRFNRVAGVVMRDDADGSRGCGTCGGGRYKWIAAADAQILTEVSEHSEAMQKPGISFNNIGCASHRICALAGDDWTADR